MGFFGKSWFAVDKVGWLRLYRHVRFRISAMGHYVSLRRLARKRYWKMKRIILGILFVLMAVPTFAAERVELYGLTKDEWQAELAFQALNVVDFVTTDRILDQGGYEMNPLLPLDGDSSDLEMGLVTVGIGALHYLVTRYVVEPEWRTTWQWFSSGAKCIAVGHNLTVVEW